MHSVFIIGCGSIAGGYDVDRPAAAPPLSHAGAFSRDDRFRIAACVDPDHEARAAFAARWGVPRSASTIDCLHASAGEFDVVAICSPSALHAAHLERTLSLQPRLIVCEKPIAAQLEDAERLVSVCQEAGILLAVNYSRRWAPDMVELSRQVRAGEWGNVLSAIGHYAKGIVHNGSHMVDLLAMFAPPLQLVAVGRPVFDHWEDDPTVSALLETREGAPVHLVGGNARAFTQFELVITTEGGEIAMRDGGRRIELRRTSASATFAGYVELCAPESRSGRYDEAMARAVDNIAGAIEHGEKLASTGENALAAQRLCDAIRQASSYPEGNTKE